MNLLLVVLAGLVGTAADWLLKAWSVDGGSSRLVGAIGVYVVATLLFAFSLRHGTILGNGTIFAVINGLGIVAISRFAYAEELTALQYGGIGLAVAGLVLMKI
jgi:multidrug transporter EmrE-like cation transporter